jgi:predicted transcriptional regulator
MGDAFLSLVLNSDFNSRSRKYRPSLEIVKDMLVIVSVKSRKTRVMYQANLSYRLMERYLKNLLENGLVECDDGSCYLITRKGKEFLQMYDDYVERCKRIDNDVNGVRKNRVLLEKMCFNNSFNSKKLLNQREVNV